jgi:hypothetical protein
MSVKTCSNNRISFHSYRKHEPVQIHIAKESLQSSVHLLIEELDKQCNQTRPDAEPNFVHVEILLKKCLELAAGDKESITFIQQKFDDFNNKEKTTINKNKLIDYIIKKEHFNLTQLLIDLKPKEIFNSCRNNVLWIAVEKGHADIVLQLLNNGVDPDHGYTAPDIFAMSQSPLSIAIIAKQNACANILLQKGADPHKYVNYNNRIITPFEFAIASNNLNLISIFFINKISQAKTEEIISKLTSVQIAEEDPTIRKKVDYIRHRVAKSLPPLIIPGTNLRCFSTFITPRVRKEVAKPFLDLLHQPPASVKHWISPLQTFAHQQTLIDPHFSIILSPQEKHDRGAKGHRRGRFYPHNGTIELFVPKKKTQDRPLTTLHHELAHKALHKMQWHSKKGELFRQELLSYALKDIKALTKNHWKSCDPAVKHRLKKVSYSYDEENQLDEYIVRIPQILLDMAIAYPQKSSAEIEKCVKKDIPYLFAIYKQHFLPHLIAYNQKHVPDTT